MYSFFIVMSGGIFGHYGKGTTIEAAQKAWRKAGGRKKDGGYRELEFASELPFAPFDRAANENESDAWVAQDGSIMRLRCDRVVREA